ncbi:hypothetical protein D3C87_2081900 [compost metagenome]
MALKTLRWRSSTAMLILRMSRATSRSRVSSSSMTLAVISMSCWAMALKVWVSDDGITVAG